MLFSDGFNRVFPMSQLLSFAPTELKLLLCGEQHPKWTREDVLAHTEPKLGFNRDRLLYDITFILNTRELFFKVNLKL